MAVEKKEDRDKLEEYFKQKLNPLLLSGAYKAVDWERVRFLALFFVFCHVYMMWFVPKLSAFVWTQTKAESPCSFSACRDCKMWALFKE